jgi:hypothetical protein
MVQSTVQLGMAGVRIHSLFAANRPVHTRMNIAVDQLSNVDIPGRTVLDKAFRGS